MLQRYICGCDGRSAYKCAAPSEPKVTRESAAQCAARREIAFLRRTRLPASWQADVTLPISQALFRLHKTLPKDGSEVPGRLKEWKVTRLLHDMHAATNLHESFEQVSSREIILAQE